MKISIGTAIVISFALLGCGAKELPQQLQITVPNGFSGPIHLRPCDLSAPNVAVVDSRGEGITAACPMENNIEIAVRRGSDTIYLTKQIKVGRTGDGIPVSITFQLP
jgi:hypothetical protein